MHTNHTTANPFPASAGLEVFDMIQTMMDRTGEFYTAMNLNYWGKGQYLTLVPCHPASTAPQIKVERNMNGAYILDNDFAYSAKAQALFASHIALMEEIEEIAANASDYEGFAVDIRLAHDAPVTAQPAIAQPAAPIAHSPAPLALIVPVVPVAPRVIITPVTITDPTGRVLTATADGWEAESTSQPGTFHHTASDGSTCSCPGHTYRGRCWHRSAVYAHRKHERDTALPISRPRKRGLARMFK